MTHALDDPIIVTAGSWQHIHRVQAYHRNFPEIRGEGGSRDEAIDHLTNQLICAQVSIPCHGDGKAFEQALVDVQSMRSRNSLGQIGVITECQEDQESLVPAEIKT